MRMNLSKEQFSVVIIGPPGSGKGTQARCLERFFGLQHIDIGMELRRVAREDTDLGKKIDTIIHQENSLVGDEIIRDVLQKSVIQHEMAQGFVLDGAPRRIGQIAIIEEIFEQSNKPFLRAISIRVPDKSLIERIEKRYFCPRCFGFYIDGEDVEDAPNAVCPRCRYPLKKREDDTPEGVKRRLSVFREETLPVIEAYRERGLLLEVDGEREIDMVCKDMHMRISEILRQNF